MIKARRTRLLELDESSGIATSRWVTRWQFVQTKNLRSKIVDANTRVVGRDAKVAYRCRNRGIVFAWKVDYSNRMAWRKFRARPGRILSE
jgi:hypothetical protein